MTHYHKNNFSGWVIKIVESIKSNYATRRMFSRRLKKLFYLSFSRCWITFFVRIDEKRNETSGKRSLKTIKVESVNFTPREQRLDSDIFGLMWSDLMVQWNSVKPWFEFLIQFIIWLENSQAKREKILILEQIFASIFFRHHHSMMETNWF